ncbi:MAG: fumarylacetoacetate hydrolase family protein [Acidobacteria bacterium]|nr:fumarylacetoacetate hydrolase family protein [Acidobacteriota bacterium]
MKYATFSLSEDLGYRLGVVLDDRVVELRALLGPQWKGKGPLPSSMLDLIEAGPAVWQQIATLTAEIVAKQRQPEGSHLLEQVRLHAPIPRPIKNIVCLGLNYVSHMEETARARGREAKIPEAPVFFTKATTTVNGPRDPILWDRSVTGQVDYEAELGVVIGVGGKNFQRASALSHVFGYTVMNDISARDLQMKHHQWFKGKSLDGFCPMGPWIVTADEFGDPQKKRISLKVNGVVKQSSTTAAMIFPVDLILEFLSKGTTLEPGDLISTGTPEGVGLGRTPPEYLRDGDLIETEIEGIGVLQNRLTASG